MPVKDALHKPVYWESVAICFMCLADAFLTVLVVKGGVALEANPLMAFFLNHSTGAFVAAKVASFVPGVIACEYLKLINPRFARFAIRLAVFGYPALYLIGELKLHGLL